MLLNLYKIKENLIKNRFFITIIIKYRDKEIKTINYFIEIVEICHNKY